MQALIISLIALLVAIASIWISGKPNTPIEKLAEEVIENELHLPDGSVHLAPEEDEGH